MMGIKISKNSLTSHIIKYIIITKNKLLFSLIQSDGEVRLDEVTATPVIGRCQPERVIEQ